ncbi:hypothetical protein GALMADRAFT_1026481 [Galerina marginata CBS 339.88]|uniref:Uncharacterized protein n=1 Tax=Galerina marginata (strain CBS 339.88) TaxID=685588 RepID=A0A067SCT0_GALM3|nr:hypothetical protein GALMADRAFT_1026481 [Galerina marginata CBS 339.88]
MPKVHKVMFWAGIVMWMLSSAHLGLVIQQVTNAMTPLRNAQAQVSIATIQVLLGDMILIWRVWAVWGGNYWMTVLPIMLMLAAAGVRFAVVASIAGVLAFSSDVSSELIVANTLLCTVLIAGRIWYLQWQMNKMLGRAPSQKSRNAYSGVLMLIIETGVLWAVIQLLGVILDDVHSDGIHAVLDMQIPLIVIIPPNYPISTTTKTSLQGMLPTLIVLFVHFDLVPGTHATVAYNAIVASKFQAATGHGTMETESTLGGTGSRRTALNLKTDISDDDIERQREYKSPSPVAV